jgi:hypothetical protein
VVAETRRRACLALASALLGIVTSSPAADSADVVPQPATMRLDVFHTGGQGLEAFAVDRVVIEPLPWPGSVERTIDTLDAGTYRFEVRDAGGRPLYSRGYSTIFEEWILTAEAAKSHRTFHESLRFPAPSAAVQVTVQKRDAEQQFQTVWQTTVDPGDMFVDRAAPPRQALVEIERHGAPPDKVDLLLLGDGYTREACAAKFPSDARRLVDTLFAQEPFRSRRADFNVWGLCPPAAEPGIARPSTQTYRRSPIGATYDAFGSERYVLTFENRAMRDVASWAPYEFLEILVNGETYGGGGIHGTFATVAADNDWAPYVFVHEFGHHFAGLADEYYTSPVAYEPVERVVEPWQPNVTALLKADQLKWRDLVNRGTPVPTPWPKADFESRQQDFQARRKQIRAERRPESEMSALFREEQAYTSGLLGGARLAGEVGVFQGANYDAQAFYRPQLDCVMFTRDEVPFCRVCQRALGQVIDLYAGPRRRD